ncbi:MAG: transposase [Clostridia bacterium]|nr:transposase [Clostridia bacterium]
MTPQSKGKKHLHELKSLLDNDDKKSFNLYQVFDLFKSKRLDNLFIEYKVKGLAFATIFYQLIEMTILNFTVHQYSSMNEEPDAGKKDVYYRLKNDPRIDWRMITYMLVNRFLFMVRIHQEDPSDKPRCLIADDTVLPKRGKTIEGIGKVFDHKDHGYKLGFKGLFLSLFDGKSFLPLDFSMHSEKGRREDRPFGMKKSELKKQTRKTRGKNLPGAKRKEELTTAKTIVLIELIKRAWKKGIHAEYLLVDSWFIDEALISFILKSKMFLLGMCKMDKRLYEYNGKENNASNLLVRLKRTKAKRSRKLNARYYQVIVVYKGIQVKLFFSRFNNQKGWSLLLTDNYHLTFEKAVEIYQIRWGIEVFFKEAKQYLQLGKCPSEDFDAQIAGISIVISVYLMLTLRKRFQAYEGLGKIFIDVQHEIIEFTLWERIWGLFLELQMSILKAWDIDLEKVISDVILDDTVLKFLTIILEQQSEKMMTSGFVNQAA